MVNNRNFNNDYEVFVKNNNKIADEFVSYFQVKVYWLRVG